MAMKPPPRMASGWRFAMVPVGLVLLAALRVEANQNPPGCNVNNLQADIAIPPAASQVPCGTVVPFTVTAFNGVDPTIAACDVTDAPVTFTCPDPATGQPTGPVTVLAASQDFPVPTSISYPPVGCTIGNQTAQGCQCGASLYFARVEAGPGTLHINAGNGGIADIIKTISVECLGGAVPHFQCYETKPQRFASVPVTLVDQFGSATAQVRRPQRLCTPTDKNGEDPSAPTNPQHMVGYELRDAVTPYLPVRNIRVTNQFGTITLDATRLSQLLVPAAKSLVGPPSPIAVPTVDHFNCYSVRRVSGFHNVQNVVLEDQFGTKTINVAAPKFFCAPVNKNNEDPGAETKPGHLLCYDLKVREFFNIGRVFTTDQFGSLQVQLVRRDELCVPSLKTLAP